MTISPLAIVTGGTHGIGEACVRALARDGFQVVFTGRSEAPGKAIESAVPGSKFLRVDASRDGFETEIVETATQMSGGKIAVLVNNAGQSRRVAFRESSLEVWDQMMSVNARAVFALTRAAIEPLIAGRGAVVTLSSIAGYVGEEELSAYCASKAALLGLMQTLAIELGQYVRFNCVCPGQIGTRMMGRVMSDAALSARSVRRVPVGRIADPSEVAEVVAFLASPRSSFVNGAIIVADGGETAGLRVLEGADVATLQNAGRRP